MPTLSIPVDDSVREQIEQFIAQGEFPSISAFGNRAFKKFLDELVVQQILESQEEPTLYGDLDELAEKI